MVRLLSRSQPGWSRWRSHRSRPFQKVYLAGMKFMVKMKDGESLGHRPLSMKIMARMEDEDVSSHCKLFIQESDLAGVNNMARINDGDVSSLRPFSMNVMAQTKDLNVLSHCRLFSQGSYVADMNTMAQTKDLNASSHHWSRPFSMNSMARTKDRNVLGHRAFSTISMAPTKDRDLSNHCRSFIQRPELAGMIFTARMKDLNVQSYCWSRPFSTITMAQTNRDALGNRSRPFSMNVLKDVNSLGHRSFSQGPDLADINIMARTKDRMHRLLMYGTTRPYEKYDSSRVVVKPTIRHLLVKLHMEGQNRNIERIEWDGLGLRSNAQPADLLEPLVFHIMIVMQRLRRSAPADDREAQLQQTQLQNMMHSKKLCAESVRKRLESETHDLVDAESSALIQSVCASGKPIDQQNQDLLKLAVFNFVMLSKLLRLHQFAKRERDQVLASNVSIVPKYSVARDLVRWIESVGVATVSESCLALTNLVDIPAFITSNVLLRTPTSINELYQQVDIWSTFFKNILSHYAGNPKYIRDCLKNIMFYSIHNDIQKLPTILTDLVQFTNSKQAAPISLKFLSHDFVNDMIWDVYHTYFRSTKSEKGNEVTNIIKSQEILVNLLHHVGAPNEKPHLKLNLKGHMGIVLAIEHVSPEKAAKLFQMAEKRFLSKGNLARNTSKELVAYNFARIILSETADDLVLRFNVAAQSHPYSSSLWLALIKKLIEFDLLTEERSHKILRQIVANKNELLLTKDMLLLLMGPMKTPESLFELIEVMSDGENIKDSLLFKAHSNLILEKYLTLLYKLPKQTTIDFPTVWRRSDSTKEARMHSLVAARYLYDTFLHNKGTKVIGIMLNGEAKHHPSKVYELYKQELCEKNSLLPDESCLNALLVASMSSSTSEPLMWGPLYAPQVAVHEFKKHVVSSNYDLSDLDSAHIYPSNQVWQTYINLLAKFEYISELSTLIHWWDDLKFTPDRRTLLILLNSLPIEFAHRYIQHFDKIKCDSASASSSASLPHADDNLSFIKHTETASDWPWPSLNEFQHHQASRRK